jgi:hypothetical protein
MIISCFVIAKNILVARLVQNKLEYTERGQRMSRRKPGEIPITKGFEDPRVPGGKGKE